MIIPNRNAKPLKLNLKNWSVENCDYVNETGIILSSTLSWETAILKSDWTIINLSDKVESGFDKVIVNFKGNIWFLYQDSTKNIFLNKNLETYIPSRIDEHLSSDYIGNMRFTEWIIIFEREDRIGIMDEDFNLRIYNWVDYGGIWSNWYITVRSKKTQEYFVIDKECNIIYNEKDFKSFDIGTYENWYFHFIEKNNKRWGVWILRRYKKSINWTVENKIQYVWWRFDSVWYIWPHQIFWWREKWSPDSKIFKIIDWERKSIQTIFKWYVVFWNYDDLKYQDEYIIIKKNKTDWFDNRDLKQVFLANTQTEEILCNIWEIFKNQKIDLNKTPIDKLLISIVDEVPIIFIALLNWDSYLIDQKWNLINKFVSSEFFNSKENVLVNKEYEKLLILSNWRLIWVDNKDHWFKSINNILNIRDTIESIEYIWDKVKIKWKLFNKNIINKKFGL